MPDALEARVGVSEGEAPRAGVGASGRSLPGARGKAGCAGVGTRDVSPDDVPDPDVRCPLANVEPRGEGA